VFFFSSLFFSLSHSLVVGFEEIESLASAVSLFLRLSKALCARMRKHRKKKRKKKKRSTKIFPLCWEIQRLSLRLRFIFKNKH
jgi:hypothetical protein